MTTQLEHDAYVESLNPVERACFFPAVIEDEHGQPLHVTRCNDFTGIYALMCRAAWAPAGWRANEIHDWLADAKNGWHHVTESEAETLFVVAAVVVASWKNPTGSHGHLCPVTGKDEQGLLFTAAGGKNFKRCRKADTFGVTLQPDYFVYP